MDLFRGFRAQIRVQGSVVSEVFGSSCCKIYS